MRCNRVSKGTILKSNKLVYRTARPDRKLTNLTLRN